MQLWIIDFNLTQYEDLLKEKAAEERRKYPLELRLKEQIIGQEAAIAMVASGKITLFPIFTFCDNFDFLDFK